MSARTSWRTWRSASFFPPELIPARLLGLMRDAGQRDVRAITLAFEEFRGDVRRRGPARCACCRALRGDARDWRVTEREFQHDLPAILEAMDQPSIDGVNTWFVAKAAREAGLKVAISGLGGDELLAGYPSFTTMPRWRRRFGALASVPGLGRLARRLIPRPAPRLRRRVPRRWDCSNTRDLAGPLPSAARRVSAPRTRRVPGRRSGPGGHETPPANAWPGGEPDARSRFRRRPSMPFWNPRIICATSFCGMRIGPAWRIASKFVCRWSTRRC